MYKISVPVLINNGKFEEYFSETLIELKRANVDRVFLGASRCVASDKVKKRELEIIKEYIPKLNSAGYEVGVWISSLGHGGNLLHETGEEKTNEYTRMRGLKDLVSDDSFCPLDEKFEAVFCNWVSDLAKAGARMIMLDDDYRLSFRGDDIFCCCDKHMQELEKRLGEKIIRDGLFEKIFTGNSNKYRNAWLNLQKDSLINFAKSLRKAVNKVDKTIRLGHCAVLSTWDLDGADSISLAKAFAGETKPFLRLIGASYWAASRSFNNMRIGSVIEYERLQQHWCKDEDIELFSECDSYPRPRYNVPSAYVEGLDTAMRASGKMDGALKYMIDYVSSPMYERGYIDRHVKNKPLYAAIEKHFDNKATQGLRIFESMNTLADADEPGDLYNRCIPASLRFTTDLCLPVTYEETDMPVIIFGDSARYVDEAILKNGAILDINAARILSEKGIDTGISTFGETIKPTYEIYNRENEKFNISGTQIIDINVKDTANVLSKFFVKKEYIGAFTYENDKGDRFLIYPFSMQNNHLINGLIRNYCRQSQLISSIKWLCGNDILAICPNNPDVYTITKSSEGNLAIGLWNFFEDSILDPIINLSKSYSKAEGINCTCRIENDKVYLSDIPPFSFAGVELFE